MGGSWWVQLVIGRTGCSLAEWWEWVPKFFFFLLVDIALRFTMGDFRGGSLFSFKPLFWFLQMKLDGLTWSWMELVGESFTLF